MQHSRKHFGNKNIFPIGLVVCLLTLFFLCQKPASQAQSSETKRDKPELVVQTGHTSTVSSVAFSPDGKLLVSGSSDNTVKLWNVETGQQIKSLNEHTGSVSSVAFSTDGKTVASGSSDNSVKLWNIVNGKQIKSLEGHSHSVNSVAFSPDGKILVSGSADKTIKLWNVESGRLVESFEGHTHSVRSVAFSPNGKTLASGSFDKTIKLWNVESGKPIRSLEGHYSLIDSVTFSPDGKTLASGGSDDFVKLWDVETGQFIKTLDGNTNYVNSVAFSPDGKILASGSSDQTIKLWNVESGQLIKLFEGHASWVKSVAFSPNGKMLASGNLEETVKLWNIENGKQINSLDGHTDSVLSVAFSPNGKALASGSLNNSLKLWNVESEKLIKSFEGHTSSIRSVAFSPDGKILASGSNDESVRLWNVESGQFIKLFEGNTSPVSSIAFSPDGKILILGCFSEIVELWDVENGKQIKSLKGHISPIESVAFSMDGKTIASGSQNGKIMLWNAENGQLVKSLKNSNDWVSSIAFSPDGKTLASGSSDTKVKLWNVETGEEIKSFDGHMRPVTEVSFSPDGKTLASGSWDNTVKLWNIESGQQIKSFEGHASSVESVAFSPDGKFLLSGSPDGTMKLWDKEGSHQPLATLISLDKNRWVVTTPDGRFDTNEDLNKIEGLIWVLPDQPLIPKPLELYMRQYYEPGLLPRVLRCAEENNCDAEFKPLPSIAEINRVQPRVEIKEIRARANEADLVDVVVEVESRTEEIAGKKLTSGVYDLRLFRDGQLVGTSAKAADLEAYIKSAPALVEKDRAAKTLLNTEEDKAWRKANNLESVVKFDKQRATFVFEKVRLPKDGRGGIEFSAYAFNDDRVKSETSYKTVEIKSPTTRAGNTYLVSIGVNTSENPAYNLNYAAVDARKTQEILGERLKAKLKNTASKLIQINLVSDRGEKTATKPIIKSLFNRLAGKTETAADFPILINGQKFSADKLPPIQPEDTLIITYSGHGYADANGIFYLLPYDIGANTEKLTTEVLPRLISSDELSLWMRDVTAREMLMIVDACHSSAAVQGDGFKPGPMASRGLGQLAYDKGMKILSATQANNVALELGGSLKQGLSSYALLQDGIFSKFADTDSNKQLFYREWLKYGEKRVPTLYEGIKNGTIKSVTIDGKPPTVEQRSGIYFVDKNRKQTLQEPRLFDFNEKRDDVLLINLP